MYVVISPARAGIVDEKEREEAAYSHRPGRCDEGTSALAVIIGDACEAFIGGLS